MIGLLPLLIKCARQRVSNAGVFTASRAAAFPRNVFATLECAKALFRCLENLIQATSWQTIVDGSVANLMRACFPLFCQSCAWRYLSNTKFCVINAAGDVLINQSCRSRQTALFKSDSLCSNYGALFWLLCACFLNAHAALVGVKGHKNKLPQELISLNGCFIILLHFMGRCPPHFSVIGSVHK